jgi:outer membrane immunogenic protein
MLPPIFRLAAAQLAAYLERVAQAGRCWELACEISGDLVMRFVFIAAAAAAGLASASASAADIGVAEPLPTPDVVVAEPANDWSGFYLGALLGYTWGDADTDLASDVEADGIDGGGYAGATWQFGNFVLGGEADILASDVEGSNGPLTVEQGVNGSLRARAGIALDQFLLYGTAGGAVSQVEVSGFGDSEEDALWGWTAGAGAEAMVFNNVTARVEYRYTDYENQTFTLGGTPAETDLSTHSVRAGVGVQF